MKMYLHTWKDKKTGEICKIGEGKIATSIDEAIASYYQEECSLFSYEQTLVVDIAAGTSQSLDIEEEINNRAIDMLSASEISAMKEFERGFNQSKYGE